MNTNNEFKGTMKEAVADIKDDIKDMKSKMDRIEKWIWIMTGALLVLGVTRLPELTKILVLAK